MAKVIKWLHANQCHIENKDGESVDQGKDAYLDSMSKSHSRIAELQSSSRDLSRSTMSLN